MVLHIWNAKFVSPRLSFFSINSVLRMQCTFVVGTLRCFRHRVYTLYLWSFMDKSLEFSDCDYISAMPLPVWVTQCSCFFEGDNVEPRSQEMPWNWRSSLSNIRWKVRKIAFCPGDRYFSAKPSVKCLNKRVFESRRSRIFIRVSWKLSVVVRTLRKDKTRLEIIRWWSKRNYPLAGLMCSNKGLARNPSVWPALT